MAANADIFFESGNLGRPLAWSLVLHLAFALFIIVYAVFIPEKRGEGWGAGGGGEAMGATLVSNVPLPANPVKTENVLANDSRGLTKSMPLPEVKPPEPEAIPIPDKESRKKPKPAPNVSRKKPEPEQPVEEASNVVPFGQGGPVSGDRKSVV